MNIHSINLRPASGTKTGRVWEIADRISREKGRCAPRKEVLKAFVAEGGNIKTASTQYTPWKKDYEARGHKPRHASPGSSGKVTLQIGAEGRLLIPIELRSMMLAGEDGKVVAHVEDGELRVISPRVALLRLQQIVKDMDRGVGSAVDELLAERRAEARNG